MGLDEPFPIQVFSRPIRETILGEFGGRCPSVREVMRIPDAHWRKLPGFGSAKVRKLRLVTENLLRQADHLAKLPDPDLLAEYRRTVEELRRLGSLQSKLRVIEVELHLRRLLSERDHAVHAQRLDGIEALIGSTLPQKLAELDTAAPTHST
jgi:hypothetical protein